MKQFVFNLILSFSLIISKLGLYLNLPILSSIAFFFSLRKIKSKNSNINKRILILEKSHGIDDFKQLQKKNLIENIDILLLSRIHIKIIFSYFSNKKKIELYKEYINKVLFYFKKLKNINLIISFNLNYKAEKIFQEINKNLNIKYVVLHKESLFSELTMEAYKKHFTNYGTFFGDHICVYSEQFKNLLIDSKVADENKISLIGAPRLDLLINNKIFKDNYILYFLIRPMSGLKNIESFTWSIFANKILEKTLHFAEQNPDIKFIFKIKTPFDNETLEQQKKIKKKNLKNCKLIAGGSSGRLVINSKFVVTFNSTAIFEGIASRKQVVIPSYDEYKNEINKYTVNFIKSENILNPKNAIEYLEILNNLCKEKRKPDITISTSDKVLLKKYMGNNDGKSSERLYETIKKII